MYKVGLDCDDTSSAIVYVEVAEAEILFDRFLNDLIKAMVFTPCGKASLPQPAAVKLDARDHLKVRNLRRCSYRRYAI
jgi:hypothetical protein